MRIIAIKVLMGNKKRLDNNLVMANTIPTKMVQVRLPLDTQIDNNTTLDVPNYSSKAAVAMRTKSRN